MTVAFRLVRAVVQPVGFEPGLEPREDHRPIAVEMRVGVGGELVVPDEQVEASN
jgi:hypothetical protein